MKKKILFLLAICIVWTALCPVSFGAGEGVNRDAYQDIFFHTVDEVPSGEPNIDTSGEFVGNTMQGTVLVYKDVDFGAMPPGIVEITYGLEGYADTQLDIGLDGTTEIIGTLTTVDTGGWASYITQEVEITKPGITGVHDLYFICVTSPVANLKSFRFEWKYTNITPPSLIFKNAWGGTASDLQYARKVGAEAKFSQNTGEENPRQAALILAQYDQEGSMLEMVYDEQTIFSNGTVSEFYAGDMQKLDQTACAGAFFWQPDMTMLAPGAIAPAEEPLQPGAAGTGIFVEVEDGRVTVAGSGIQDERIALAIVPAVYNPSAAIWTEAVQLYELGTAGNGFSYQFRMNPGLPSGQYTVLIRGAQTNLQKGFSYTSPAEIYEILSFISAEQDSGAVIEKIRSAADIFGAEPVLFENIGNFDADCIQAGIQAYFAQNPLAESDSYKPWLDGLRPVIISQAVLACGKAKIDAGQMAVYIQRYANLLGIDASTDYQKFYTDIYRESIAKAVLDNVAPESVASDFTELFAGAVVVGVFNGAQSWGHVDDALMSFGGRIGINTANYRRMVNSAKAELCGKFLGKHFQTIAEISSLFSGLIGDYQDEALYRTDYERVPSQVGGAVFSVDVVVVPEAEPETPELPAAFADLDNVPWAKEEILAMYNAGYVSGKSETAFAPGDSITREEFAVILARAFGLGQGSLDSLRFVDVDKTAWYAPYLAAAAQHGVVAGITDTEFGVGSLITREQMAAMLQRAVDAVGKNILPKRQAAAFLDSADIAPYAYDAVLGMAKAEIISGVGGELFAPRKIATRAEAVVMISQTLENMR